MGFTTEADPNSEAFDIERCKTEFEARARADVLLGLAIDAWVEQNVRIDRVVMPSELLGDFIWKAMRAFDDSTERLGI